MPEVMSCPCLHESNVCEDLHSKCCLLHLLIHACPSLSAVSEILAWAHQHRQQYTTQQVLEC